MSQSRADRKLLAPHSYSGFANFFHLGFPSCPRTMSLSVWSKLSYVHICVHRQGKETEDYMCSILRLNLEVAHITFSHIPLVKTQSCDHSSLQGGVGIIKEEQELWSLMGRYFYMISDSYKSVNVYHGCPSSLQQSRGQKPGLPTPSSEFPLPHQYFCTVSPQCYQQVLGNCNFK